jgi:uncharacterized RDD family membrane protein YckC
MMVDGAPGTSRPYATRPGPVPPVASWPVQPAQTEGVLGRRWVAYLVDLVAIFFFTALLSILIGIVGLVTFGLGWSLFAVLPFTAVLYSAVTVGGRAQATPGMRMMGLRAVDAATGGPVGMITAAVHALLFYVAAGTFILWVVDLFVGFARSDRRLGHDLLAGVALVRAL